MKTNKWLSRKFVVTIIVFCAAIFIPILYKHAGVSETVILAVLGIVGGIGVAYGIINVQDAKVDKKTGQE